MNKHLAVAVLAVVFALSTVLSSPAAFADRHKGRSQVRGAPLAGLLVKGLAGGGARHGRGGHSSNNKRGSLLASPGVLRSVGSLLNQAPRARSGHSGRGNSLGNVGSLLNLVPQARNGHSGRGDSLGNIGSLLNLVPQARNGHSNRGQRGDLGISPDTLRGVGSWLNRRGAFSSGRGAAAYDPVAAYGYGGYGNNVPAYPYHAEMDSAARAYRDVGLANAMVNLVGIAATAATQNAYARPAGCYVREKVIVQPSHYETVRVWVPEIYDPHTGQKIGGGYYETRTQLAPEVAEYRDVWTPAVP